jgi:hypothetical protein
MKVHSKLEKFGILLFVLLPAMLLPFGLLLVIVENFGWSSQSLKFIAIAAQAIILGLFFIIYQNFDEAIHKIKNVARSIFSDGSPLQRVCLLLSGLCYLIAFLTYEGRSHLVSGELQYFFMYSFWLTNPSFEYRDFSTSFFCKAGLLFLIVAIFHIKLRTFSEKIINWVMQGPSQK